MHTTTNKKWWRYNSTYSLFWSCWRWAVLTPEKHSIGCWEDHGVGLDISEKSIFLYVRGIVPILLGHPTHRLVSASTTLSRLADRDERSASLSNPLPTEGHYVHNQAFCLSHPPFLTIYQINVKLATPSSLYESNEGDKLFTSPAFSYFTFQILMKQMNPFPLLKAVKSV
jgi:hypothetical protein